MEQVYKGHIIRSAAAAIRDSIEWKPIAQINWTEDGKERVKLWMEWCFAVLRPTKMPKWKRMFSLKTGLVIRTEIPRHKDPHTSKDALSADR